MSDDDKNMLEHTIEALAIECNGKFFPAVRVSCNQYELTDQITGEVSNPSALTTQFGIPFDEEHHALACARSFVTIEAKQIKQSLDVEMKRMADWLASPERQAQIDKSMAHFAKRRANVLEDSSEFLSSNIVDWLPGAMNMRFGPGRCTIHPVYQVPDKKEGESDEDNNAAERKRRGR